MPIQEKVKIGDRTATQITFGFGDIAIYSGRKSANPEIKTLVLAQDLPRPQDEWHQDPEFKPGTTTDQIPGPFVELVFRDIRSIEILMGQLELIRNEMKTE